jgi:hypothetical protein
VSQYAEAYLGRIFSPGAEVTVRVDLLTYAVDGPVTTNLRFTVTTQERLLFQRDYRGVGESGWGAMLLGRESAIRQASEESLRSCFEQFISDVQQEHPHWHRDAAQRVAPVGVA